MAELQEMNIVMERAEDDGTVEKNFDHDSVTDILQTCRVCACVNNYFIPIYDGEGVEHDLGSKINQYLPINVSEADELPTQLCYQCASLLITWHEMFIGSLKAEEDLRKLKQRLDDDRNRVPKGAEGGENAGKEDEEGEAMVFPEQPMVAEMSDASYQPGSPTSETAELKTEPADDDSQDYESLVDIDESRCLLNTSDNESIENSTELSAYHLCQPCGNVYKTYDEFMDHNKQEHDSTEISIKVAPVFDIEPHFLKKRRTFTCQVCGLVLSTENNLRKHLMSAHNEPEDGDILKQLLQKQQGPKKKSFECKQCTRKNYHQHLPNGQLLKKYKCETCFKCFASKSEYQTHALTHSDLKPFMCDLCGKCFKVKNSLSNHVKYTHVRQRKFQCTFCGWTACRKYNLDVHMRRHTGQKPFACEVCGRRFTQKNDMLKHQTRHDSDCRPMSVDDSDDSMSKKEVEC